MMLVTRIFFALAICLLAVSPALATSNKPTLDTWVDGTLIPSIVSQLNTHPRFKSEIVRFVIMQDGKPAATTNALAIALRDRLQDAVIDQTGIRVGWQVDRQKFDPLHEQSRVDCTTGDVHYYIGLELEELRSGRFTVSVRALDVEQQSWIAGFGAFWQGPLTTLQHRAYRQPDADPAFLGQRSVPFEDSQTDLLAAQLAHELGCALLRQMSGEYVASLSIQNDGSSDKTLELVSNNLANYQAMQISPDPTGTNSIIEARAHPIDDDLFQYWVTITPTSADTDMPTISASAYIYLEETFMSASPSLSANLSGTSNVVRNAVLISSLQVVTSNRATACRTSSPYSTSNQCNALQAMTEQDSVVFFIYHQLNNGLVRLGDRSCSARSDARIAREGQPLLVPMAMDSVKPLSWSPGRDWMVEPDVDTFYVVASNNTKAARALGRHVEQLPKRCGYGVRPGLEGAELRRWFRELDAITDHWRDDIDWQSVRVKNVY
jgi:hypothetical protein